MMVCSMVHLARVIDVPPPAHLQLSFYHRFHGTQALGNLGARIDPEPFRFSDTGRDVMRVEFDDGSSLRGGPARGGAPQTRRIYWHCPEDRVGNVNVACGCCAQLKMRPA